MEKKAVQEEAKADPSVPLLIPCEACGKEVSKKTEKCLSCDHPATDSVVAYKKAKPFGGFEVLAMIKEAKESGAAELVLPGSKEEDLPRISAVPPLAGWVNLKKLNLWGNEISDLSPLKELTKLWILALYRLIPEDQKAMLKKALPNCEIKLRP